MRARARRQSSARRHMQAFLPCAIGIVVIAIFYVLVRGKQVPVLFPAGTLASHERDLIIFGALLSLLVILPVFVLTGWIVWRYRDSRTRAAYAPNLDGNKKLEVTWWTIPALLILVLSIVTWRSSYALDPSRPLVSEKTPISIYVVALEWKWLFIYPEEGISTVNYLQIPVDTPITFRITADAPMNSFWIPHLSGQIYAMNGMTTTLHIEATKEGTYPGVSANISGTGFSDMRFETHVTDDADYTAWKNMIIAQTSTLDYAEFLQLTKPSVEPKPLFYARTETALYDRILMKNMGGH